MPVILLRGSRVFISGFVARRKRRNFAMKITFKSLFIHLGLLLAHLIILCSSVEVDFTIELEPGKRECFHQFIPKGIEYDVEYQVIEGGDMDINFVIRAPSGQTVLTELRRSAGSHGFDTKEEGDYQFCLDNSFSRFSKKLVFFELMTDENEDEDDWGALPTDDTVYEMKIEDFKVALDKIKERLESSINTQKVMKVLEAKDRGIAERSFSRVNFWSGVQLFLMVSVSLVHVLLIRSLFENKKTGGYTKVQT